VPSSGCWSATSRITLPKGRVRDQAACPTQ
jgi:hypothetical protein